MNTKRWILLLAVLLLTSVGFNVAVMIRHYNYMQRENSNNKKVFSHYPIFVDKLYHHLAIQKDDIIFIGDSHTAMFNFEDFLPKVQIKNRGIGGDITEKIQKRINYTINGTPDKIFIQVGINDINLNTPVDLIIPHFSAIVDSVQHKSIGTKVYVQSVFPQTGRVSIDSITKFNSKLKALCAIKKIAYIDIYSSLVLNGKLNPKFDCGDGLHLNYNGYKLWSRIITPYLK